MKAQFIEILLVAGLNLPIFLELYKHILKSKAVWLRVTIAIVYWGMVIWVQTAAALGGILYLYFAYYRHKRDDEISDSIDVWKIKAIDAVKVILMTASSWLVIFFVNFLYTIRLVKLVKYNIKPQDIVTYYSEATLIVEEYVFRYFLFAKVLAPRMPLFIAAIFSSALFTMLHFNVSGIPTFFGLGLFFTYLYQKKGYWATVIAHSVSNLITLLFL